MTGFEQSPLELMCALTSYASKTLATEYDLKKETSNDLQLRAKQTAHLINEHYKNEVTLTEQNLPLKCCQPLEILTYSITGLDIAH